MNVSKLSSRFFGPFVSSLFMTWQHIPHTLGRARLSPPRSLISLQFFILPILPCMTTIRRPHTITPGHKQRRLSSRKQASSRRLSEPQTYSSAHPPAASASRPSCLLCSKQGANSWYLSAKRRNTSHSSVKSYVPDNRRPEGSSSWWVWPFDAF